MLRQEVGGPELVDPLGLVGELPGQVRAVQVKQWGEVKDTQGKVGFTDGSRLERVVAAATAAGGLFLGGFATRHGPSQIGWRSPGMVPHDSPGKPACDYEVLEHKGKQTVGKVSDLREDPEGGERARAAAPGVGEGAQRVGG